MDNDFLSFGALLVILGAIGILLDSYIGLMWFFVIMGVMITIWGLLITKPPKAPWHD